MWANPPVDAPKWSFDTFGVTLESVSCCKASRESGIFPQLISQPLVGFTWPRSVQIESIDYHSREREREHERNWSATGAKIASFDRVDSLSESRPRIIAII